MRRHTTSRALATAVSLVLSGPTTLPSSSARGAEPAGPVALAPTQGGTCHFSVSPSSLNLLAAGGRAELDVETTPEFGCSWTASTDVSWIHLDFTEGYGPDSLELTVDPYNPVAPNLCNPRAGVIRIENVSIPVSQSAPLDNSCLTNNFPQPRGSSGGGSSRYCCASTAASVLTNGTSSLELARRYRDEVLARSPRGRELVRQYYAHTDEVVRMMSIDPWLIFRAARLLERHTTTLKAAVDGEASISPEDVEEIDGLLASIEGLASPDLRNAIADFRTDLRSTDVQATCAIRITGTATSKAPPRAFDSAAPFVGIGTGTSGGAMPMRVPDVLAIGARGRSYVKWYRAHYAEAMRVLSHDPVLAMRALSAVTNLKPVLHDLVEGVDAVVPDAAVVELDTVLAELQRKGSPEFARSLAQARRDLATPRVLAGFGLRRVPRSTASRVASAPLAFVGSQNHGAFVARGPGYGISVAPTGFDVRLSRPSRAAVASESSPSTDARLEFEGARTSAVLAGASAVSTRVSELVGNDPAKWHRDAPAFARVAARDVYPGIDVVYGGSQRALDYGVVVAPHADPSQIRLRVVGASGPRIGELGELIVGGGADAIVQRPPVAYQLVDGVRRPVAARYRLVGHSVLAFALGAYDPSRELVVAPSLELGSAFGGVGEDGASDVAMDSEGNIYVTGFAGVSSLATPSGFQTQYGGGDGDAFVVKLDPTGSTVLYATYLGGQGQDFAGAIGVDASGAAYVCGTTASSNFPTVGKLQPGLRGAYDAFVAKLDPTGSTLQFSTLLGGQMLEAASGIAVDANGAIVVCGATSSDDFPTTVGAYSRTARGVVDAFVARIDPTAKSLVWSTRVGGSSHDGAADVAIDAAGNAVVVGATASNDFPSLNAPHALFNGFVDGFVTRVAADGRTLLSSTFLGGDDLDGCGGVALDASGAIYVTGATASANFPVASPAQATFGGGYLDAFAAKLTADGAAVAYATYLGGSDDDRGYRIAVDAAGNAYVTGITDSTNFPTAHPLQPALTADTFDAFASALDATGTRLVYSTYLGGDGDDTGIGVAVDGAGDAVFVGETNSQDFPVPGVHAGAYDAFVLKVPAPPVVPPPVVDAVAGPKPGKPFQLKISGSNFQTGIQVFIGGGSTPWPNAKRKSDGLLVLKKGATLQALFPAGQATSIVLANPDGGTAVTTFTRN